MSVMTIKMDKELRDAIRVIAFADGHSSSSRAVKEILLSHPRVIKEKKNIKKYLAGK